MDMLLTQCHTCRKHQSQDCSEMQAGNTLSQRMELTGRGQACIWSAGPNAPRSRQSPHLLLLCFCLSLHLSSWLLSCQILLRFSFCPGSLPWQFLFKDLMKDVIQSDFQNCFSWRSLLGLEVRLESLSLPITAIFNLCVFLFLLILCFHTK